MNEQEWMIQLARPAQKALRQRPSERDRLQRAIAALPAGDVRRLQGSDDYRLRVADWRITFRLDYENRMVVVLLIEQRGQAYRRR